MRAMSDLNQSDRVLIEILEESWKVFWKDVLVYLLAAVICAVLLALSLGLLSGTLAVGFALLIRRLRNGENVGASAVLEGFSHFFGATLATLVILLGVTVGLALLVLPGLFLTAAWSMTFHAMATEDLGAGAALSRSYKVFKEHSLIIVLLLIVLGVLNTIASALLLAALLAVPYSAIAISIAYEKLVSRSPARTKEDTLSQTSSGAQA